MFQNKFRHIDLMAYFLGFGIVTKTEIEFQKCINIFHILTTNMDRLVNIHGKELVHGVWYKCVCLFCYSTEQKQPFIFFQLFYRLFLFTKPATILYRNENHV